MEPAFLDAALSEARAIEGIIRGLIAVPEAAGFALDPNWATLYPYQATVVPGEPADLTVRIVNHLSASATARADLRLPVGWTSETPTAEPGARHVVAAPVTLGDRQFGPVAEGIIRVQSAS